MIVWNDLEADEKVTVYDKGGQDHKSRRPLRSAGEFTGQEICGRPQLEQIEALRQELGYFVECVYERAGAS
ncbi:MAG: hypothetical protein WDM87_05135 [Terracidiphilus sp.]